MRGLDKPFPYNRCMIPRFYCPDLVADDVAIGSIVQLPAAAAHHAGRVLRLVSGDGVTLFNGHGHAWQASLTEVSRTVNARIEAIGTGAPEPALRITLVQALPSGDKMDWVVQKAVELGAHAIQPVAAKRSVVRLSGERATKRIQHLQEVAISACEQCGRNQVPLVLPLLDLPQYLARPCAGNEQRFLMSPLGQQRLRDMAAPATPVTLLIGPEGGLDADEEAAAQRAGFSPLLFGPRILRTETAGLAALAAMMALWGDV